MTNDKTQMTNSPHPLIPSPSGRGMSRRDRVRVFIVFVSCFLIIAANSVFAGEFSVQQILDKMEKAGDYTTSQGNAVMKIINSNGDTTEMGLVMYEKKGDKDKSLMCFTSPARLDGTAILSIGDDIWYYNNRTNRVRLLSRSAKKGSMMGSSFSYEDLELSYAKDFTGEILKEDGNYYTLKLFPKNKEMSYKYLIVKTRKLDFLVESAEYYNQNGLKYKELADKDFKKIKNRIMPMTVEMKDLEENKLTVIESDEKTIQYDIKLDDKMFSERNLRK